MNDVTVSNLIDKHSEDLERIKKFRLLDDDFMTKVFEDRGCAELLLKVILDREDIRVVTTTPQNGLKNLQGRSVRLDILVEDTQGRIFNVEVQRSDRGADRKRARYNSALIDANITEAGEDFKNIQESFVIFITERDVIGANLPIYHIDRVIKETGALFEDEAHIIYVNAQIKDETSLGLLMHDFACTDADDMHYAVLADRVRYFKEDLEGVRIMCRIMEEVRDESAKEAALKEKNEMIISMHDNGLADEMIAQIAKVTVDYVRKILGFAFA